MSNENPSDSDRLYVPAPTQLEAIREWLFISGLDAKLHVEETHFYFDVTLPENWDAEKRTEFARQLAAVRAKLLE